MKRGRPARWVFALVALAAVLAAPAPAPAEVEDETRPEAPASTIADAWVIIDSHLAPADVEGRLLACRGMPGCRAVWQEGVGIVLILGFEPQSP